VEEVRVELRLRCEAQCLGLLRSSSERHCGEPLVGNKTENARLAVKHSSGISFKRSQVVVQVEAWW